MLWLGCGLFLERNWVGVGVVVSFCEKIVLMLLLGCVIRSNCGCGCGWGHSSEVDCVVVVVVQFWFCSSLMRAVIAGNFVVFSALYSHQV